ncbi:MAG TPA: DUF1987 domain-containing protein [Bacteroidales bacterium]|nr:DUF1987 domain-containing protein [Bacteroidales bacterium]
MDNIFIQKTDSTPEIDFNVNGNLKIFGRSLPEDVHKFYDPIVYWVNNLEVEHVKIDLKLEYLNTSSTKKILNLLLALEENEKIKSVDINWHYEYDDVEMEELGQIYEDDLRRCKFHYIEGVDIF